MVRFKSIKVIIQTIASKKERERIQKQAEYEQYVQEKNRLEQSILQKKATCF